MGLPKELCLETYDHDKVYVCIREKNHVEDSHMDNRNGVRFYWRVIPEVNYKELYDNMRMQRDEIAIHWRMQFEKAHEENDVLQKKIQNQAKSLTEMHKGIKHEKHRAEYHRAKWEDTANLVKQLRSSSYGLDYHAVKKENDSLRKELADLRENFAYNENSWRESNEYLKNELTTANDTIADYKAVIKQKSEEITKLDRKIKKWEEWWKRINASIGFNPVDE